MGLGEKSNRTWLTIGFGAIRKKADKETPGAVERLTKSGDKTYAIEYKFIDGTLEDVRFKDDPQYGKSWSLFVADGKEKYAVQIKEKSRYASDLLKRIPRLVKGQCYKFLPYDFDSNGKRKQGLNVYDAVGEKIESYYETFEQVDKGWKVTHVNGLPEYKGKPEDKDSLEIFFLEQVKFLREKALEHIQGNFREEIEQPVSDVPPPTDGDEIPF